jgi:hypothetical protein
MKAKLRVWLCPGGPPNQNYVRIPVEDLPGLGIKDQVEHAAQFGIWAGNTFYGSSAILVIEIEPIED